MRLFIAINFTEEVKSKIYEEEIKLEKALSNGHITSKENIHLTLVFIGETNNPKIISDCINHIKQERFDVFIKGLNYFPRGEKRLYYLELEKNPILNHLYEFLYQELTAKGFELEYRPFTPHITLGREIVLKTSPDIKQLNLLTTISKISLMESRRINGELKYIELYKKELY